MDPNFIFFFIGILITIIIGALSVYFTIVKVNKNILYFIKFNYFSLFNPVMQEISEIEIYYKKKLIDKDLIVLKGSFLNGGDIDIVKDKIHKPLSIKLPANCKWRNLIITKESDGLTINPIFKNELVEFNWDILKSGEYFSFESVFENTYLYDNKQAEIELKDLKDEILVSHRIESFQSDVKKELPVLPSSFLVFLGLLLLFLFLLTVSSIRTYESYYARESTTYNEGIIGNTNYYFRGQYNADNFINLIDTTGSIHDVISLDKWNSLKYTGNKKVVYEPFDTERFYVGIILSLIFFVFLLIHLILFIKSRMDYRNIKTSLLIK